MSYLFKNLYARIFLVLIAYYASFAVFLLQINTIVFQYVENGTLYIVMVEHLMIAFLFGLFWSTLTGLNRKQAVLSVLILPTMYFIIIFASDFFIGELKENHAMVYILIALCNYIGAFLGSAACYGRINNE